MSIAILLVTQIARHDPQTKYSDSQTALPLHHATAQTERADARLAYNIAATWEADTFANGLHGGN